MATRFFAGLLLLCASAASHGGGIANATVEGNTLNAEIALGLYSADVSLEFEDAVGLSVDNVGLSAQIVNPSSSTLDNRLPNPTQTSISTGFPVMLVIDPPASGGLSFSSVASITLHTHDLNYDPAVPLRLFSAESGGQFHDITQRVSSGSYRVRGSKGQFSEFLIVLDARTNADVINAKFGRLNTLLNNQQSTLPPTLFSALSGLLGQAQTAAQNGSFSSAIEQLEGFSTLVAESADAGVIPNVWRSSEDVVNVAGLLNAGTDTLSFSLSLASNSL